MTGDLSGSVVSDPLATSKLLQSESSSWGLSRDLFWPLTVIQLFFFMVLTHLMIHEQTSDLRQKSSDVAMLLADQVGRLESMRTIGGLEGFAEGLLNASQMRSVTVEGADGDALLHLSIQSPIGRRGLFESLVASYAGLDSLLSVRVPVRGHESIDSELLSGDIRGTVEVTVETLPTVRTQVTAVAILLLLSLLSWLAIVLFLGRGLRRLRHSLYELGLSVREMERGFFEVRSEQTECSELWGFQQALNQLSTALKGKMLGMEEELETRLGRVRDAEQLIDELSYDLEQSRHRTLEAKRTQSGFISAVTTELMTPIERFSSSINYLTNSLIDREQRAQLLECQGHLEQMKVVVSDLSDYVEMESGGLVIEPRVTLLQDVIDDALAPLIDRCRAHSVDVVRMVYVDVPHSAVVDPSRLRQIITYLLSSALDRTHDGTIVVRMLVEKEDGGDVELRVSVADNGMQLSEYERDHMFQPFIANSDAGGRGGTGIGMALARYLVRRMHGDVSVESGSGSGTTVSFTFRAKNADTLDDHASPAPLACRVLLSDAHSLARVATANLMRGLGMEVEEIERHSVISNQLAVSRPRLLVCGMADEECDRFARRMVHWRAIGGDLRIIVLVSDNTSCDTRMLLDAGADLVLPRLTRLARLASEVRRLAQPLCGEVALHDDQQSVSNGHLTILLVDDSPINLTLLQTQLTSRPSVEVDLADDGSVAVERALKRNYDLILMDLRMPAMDGIEATRQIRANEAGRRRVPIVAVSAEAMMVDRGELTSAGFDLWVAKPVSEAKLWSLVEEMTGVLPPLADESLPVGEVAARGEIGKSPRGRADARIGEEPVSSPVAPAMRPYSSPTSPAQPNTSASSRDAVSPSGPELRPHAAAAQANRAAPLSAPRSGLKAGHHGGGAAGGPVMRPYRSAVSPAGDGAVAAAGPQLRPHPKPSEQAGESFAAGPQLRPHQAAAGGDGAAEARALADAPRLRMPDSEPQPEQLPESGQALANGEASDRPSTAAGEGLPVYDLDQATRLAGGSPELASKLLGMLLDDLATRRESIRNADERGDREDLRFQVHKLHGSAANCCTMALKDAAKSLEILLDNKEFSDWSEPLSRLQREMERVLDLKQEG